MSKLSHSSKTNNKNLLILLLIGLFSYYFYKHIDYKYLTLIANIRCLSSVKEKA